MKCLVCNPSDSVMVDETNVAVAIEDCGDEDRDDGYAVVVYAIDGEHEVFCTQSLCELPPDCQVDRGKLDLFVAKLVKARLEARLAAKHVTHIPDDHLEFATCMLFEQQKILSKVKTLSPEYVQDYVVAVGWRVTGGSICIHGRYFPRRESSTVAVEPTEPDEREWGSHRLVQRNVTDADNFWYETIHRGTEVECLVLLDKIANTPWQETITHIELSRWMIRHIANYQTEAQSAPGRSITIPEHPVEPTA